MGLALLTILGGACLFYGIIVLQATLAFWTTESLEIVNTVTYGGVQSTSYPLAIYRRWFQRFFTFVVPLACVSYFPVVAILGRDDPLGTSRLFQILAPLVGVAFLVLCTARVAGGRAPLYLDRQLASPHAARPLFTDYFAMSIALGAFPCHIHLAIMWSAAPGRAVGHSEEEVARMSIVDQRRLRFAFITPCVGEAFFGPVKTGMRDAARMLDADCTFEGTADVDLAEQEALIRRALAQGVDGLALSIPHPTALNAAILEALERIPVVAFNVDATAGLGGRLTSVRQDCYQAGLAFRPACRGPVAPRSAGADDRPFGGHLGLGRPRARRARGPGAARRLVAHAHHWHDGRGRRERDRRSLAGRPADQRGALQRASGFGGRGPGRGTLLRGP